MAVDKYDVDYKHSLEECIANFPIYSRLVFKEKASWRLKGVHNVDTEIRKILVKTFEPGDSVMIKGYWVDDENDWYPIIEDRSDLYITAFHTAWKYPPKYEIMRS